MEDMKETRKETGNSVKERMGYLLHYQDNIKKLNDQIERLNDTRKQIEEANKNDGRSRESNVEEWLKKFDEISKEANQLRDKHDQDENSRRCGSSSWHSPDWKLRSRCKRGREAKRLVTLLDELILQVPLSMKVNYASQMLESRHVMKENILDALAQSSPEKTIAIYGPPGVGKSHLVSEIVKQVSDEGKLVVVQQSVSPISKEVIKNEIEREVEARSKTNGSITKSKKSVLTILDVDKLDRVDDLKSLGIPLQDDENYEGCKLLLVSRDRRVLQDKGADRYFKIDPLNYEESRILFLIEATSGSKDGLKDDDNLRQMAKEVASRCEGLRLAIVKMAELCKTKGKEVNVNLNESDFEKMEKKICSSAEKSYNKLEEKAKKVFLVCVGVHEAPILIDDLLKYAIGLGIFGNQGRSIKDTREELEEIIGELKASSLLVDDNNAREVKVNALIYNTTPLIASRNDPPYQVFRSNVFSPPKSWPETDVLKVCTQITWKLCHIPELPTRLDCPTLNFLYLDATNNKNTLVIPESFFERVENLQVVDLIGMIMPSLPTSLVFLTKLKTLCLRQCILENITGIGALKSLEILNFSHSDIKEFFGEIVQLTHLRMLDLSYSIIEVIPPTNIVSKLTKLEELYVGNVVISVKQSLKEILAALELLTSFTALELQIHEDCISPSSKILFEKLQRFNIVIGDGWEWSDSNGTSKLLKLKLHNNIHLQAMKNLIKSAEDLHLDEINGISNDVLCELNDEGFPHIRKLHIQNNTKIEHVVQSRESNQTSAAWFQNLETLKLVNLSNLIKICDGPLALPSLKNLKVVKVKRCGRLEYLLPVSMIKHVSQLVEIDVYECSSMKTIVSLDSSSSSSDPIVFSSLDSLTLQHLALNGLGPINNGTANNPPLFSNPKDPLSSMKHLKLTSISFINHLASLTTNDATSVVPLQNLESLEIEECSDISCLFNSESSKLHETFRGLLPKIRQLCLLNLGSFKSMVKPKHPEGILNFHRLNHLKLFCCKELKYVLPLYILKNLQQLQTIDVRDCENLERIFGDEKDKQMVVPTNETMLPFLRSLRLTNLPMLISIYSGDHHIISHSLTQMIAQNCPKFCFTFSNSKVNLPEKDPIDLQNSTEAIYPCLLENLDLGGLNQLKMVTKYLLVSFMHLTSLKVYECGNLKNLLHFTVAQKLSSLQELKIISCKNVEQILSRGTSEGKPSENDIVEFPKVETLVLENLPELIGVLHGCTIIWHALKRVSIVRCPKINYLQLGTVNRLLLEPLEVIQCGPWERRDHTRNLFYLFHVTDEISQPELEINSDKLKKYLSMKIEEDSFWNLRSLKATQCNAELSKLVSILLRQANQLEVLIVEKCESLEQVFDLREFDADEDQMDSGFPNLKKIRLFDLPKLNCIWNKNPTSIVKLGTLVKLEIIKCGLHESPISLAVLEELVLLEELKIESCEMIEHVVNDDKEEMQDKVFRSLRDVKLVSLPKLMKFNSSHCNFIFPKLQSLVIEKCPKMNAFTAGFLSSQIIIEGISNDAPQNKHACPVLQTLKLEDLKGLEVDSLSRLEKLQTLSVRNCSSQKTLVLPSNLREIEISGCDKLEEISIDREQEKTDNNTFRDLESIVLENLPELSSFSFEPYDNLLLNKLRIGNSPKLVTLPWNLLNKHSTSLVLFDNIKENSPPDGDQMNILDSLESLELSDLPNMNLWKQEPKFAVFQALSKLKIMHCKPMEKLFSISVAQHLIALKSLTLYGCENMVQLLDGEGGERKLVFQKLETLVLRNLPSLTSFCENENVDFDKFPVLKQVRVEDVPNMSTFVKKPLHTPMLKHVYVTNITKCWQGDINKTITYLHQNRHGMMR